jgi:hypothetical protein
MGLLKTFERKNYVRITFYPNYTIFSRFLIFSAETPAVVIQVFKCCADFGLEATEWDMEYHVFCVFLLS